MFPECWCPYPRCIPTHLTHTLCTQHVIAPHHTHTHTQLRAKLALVDLAGSERAAETNNAGQKLRDGANINRCEAALHCAGVLLCFWVLSLAQGFASVGCLCS